MLKWTVCIADAGRSLQAGRSLTIPGRHPGWTPAPRPQGDPQGGRTRLPPLNPQDPPNQLSHIPNEFESYVFALASFNFVCLRWCCFSTPLGRAVLWEVRCMPRRVCVGAQGFVAFGNGQRWGGEFPLEVPPGLPLGFDQRFSQRPPQRFPQSPPGPPPAGSQGCSPRPPRGFLQGFPRDS